MSSVSLDGMGLDVTDECEMLVLCSKWYEKRARNHYEPFLYN